MIREDARTQLYLAAIEAFGRNPNARVLDIGNLCGMRKSVVHYYMQGGIEQLRREAWDYYAEKCGVRNFRYELSSLSHAMTRPDLARKVSMYLARYESQKYHEVAL